MSHNANYRTQRSDVRACLRQRHGFLHRNWVTNSGLVESLPARTHTPRGVDDIGIDDIKPEASDTGGPLSHKRDY
ncbi:MAG: hypothetical protein PF501_20620 [Salinisphaera sp.]|jgi:hypothetical protein|nr:hypothetical protein [Salinisphaera sp.]